MPIVLAIACCSLLIAASPSHAQSTACGVSTALTLSAGVGQNDRVDATASPFQFRGRGLELSVNAAHSSGRVCMTLDAGGGTKLLSTREGTSATERLAEGDAGFGVLRTTWMRSLSIGAEARGELAITDHAYTDPRHIVATYRIGALSFGPAARWQRRFGRGDAVVQLSAPVVALIDHPYFAVWSTDPQPTFRLASVGEYRAAHAAFSYSWTAWRGVASVLSYRVNGVRYDDVHPLRSLSQSLTVGAHMPFAP